MIAKSALEYRYLRLRRSVSEIAREMRISEGTVNYWIAKHGIQKRSISEAIYQKWNPHGDPFSFRAPKNIREAFVYGLGLGLYWGEGTKKSKTAVRLGNSDPRLIRAFIEFLVSRYGVETERFKFGLQIFGDMDMEKTLRFWMRALHMPRSRFYKVTVTPYRGVGNYTHKTKHGVLTVYFSNKKLRDILVHAIEKMPMVKPM